MTYKQLEAMYCNVNWSDPESVKRYEKAAKEYRKQKEAEQKQTAKK